MITAKVGDKVRVHYTATLADGTELDSSRDREPLELRVGDGVMLPDFEDAVVGMFAGERKTIVIPCESAYGEHDAAMDLTVSRDALPEHFELAVGTVLRAQGPEGETATFTVTAIEGETVMIDGNHPLAGHDLRFELELVEIA